jgi:GAF domain-containing protein
MTALDDTATVLRRRIAELRRELDECTAERDEAVAQQAATAEVLQVINSSPGNLAPVFKEMLEKATHLCDAPSGIFWTFDGELSRAAALHGIPDAFAEYLREPIRLDPVTGLGRVCQGEQVAVSVDLAAEEPYRAGNPQRRAFVDLGQARSAVRMPLIKDSRLLGIFTVYRQEVRPFTDKQIALLQNFAAQAVIAMENARLINETREALEQQTATSEVLQVINSSPGDLAPVFNAILEKAHSLCDIAQGSLELYDGEWFRAVAVRGLSDEFAEILRQRCPAADNPATQPLIEGRRFAHILDLAQTDYTVTRSAAELDAARTLLCVPLRRDGALLGMIASARREARAFSDKEIALLENFAAQAVIAMENARLITETREALEQQTATAEVLQVINSSPGDLAPVFDAILEKAHRLCGIDFGALQLQEGGKFRSAAARGLAESLVELLRQPFDPVPGSPPSRLLSGERIVHIADMAELARQRAVDERAQAVAKDGFRTGLFVPLRKDADLLGYIVALRREVRPYSEKEIALVQNFAAQAVIAMENARLINETREALEQQTATSEVLQVINSSPGDLTPVFDAMLDRALRLCEAAFGILLTFDGETLRTVSFRNVPEGLAHYVREPLRPDPNTTIGRVVRERRTIHTYDNAQAEPYRKRAPLAVAAVELGHVRTVLHVPLIKDETVLGIFIIFRQEVRSFSDKQIALMQNFAAQAVIAVENARLITETREALERQTATAEVLQVINSSPGDLAPVFDAMLDNALRLCGGSFGELRTYDGERFRLAATHGVPTAYLQHYAQGESGIYGPGTGPARILAGERVLHIPDLIATEPYQRGDPDRIALVELGGARADLLVPLLKDAAVLGYIMIYRMEVGSFTDKQIALLQNFAAQAVIAMENARLLTETREALEQQTATAEVLQVINASPGDLAPVFDNILNQAHNLCGASRGALFLFDRATFRAAAAHGYPEDFAERLRQGISGPIFAPLIEGARLIHYPDLTQIDDPLARSVAESGGVRTNLLLPLRKDGALLGMISCNRGEVRPFSDKEIALLENFAAQAVIAMENARLINELRDRTLDLQESLEYQTATSDVLKVISRSTFDLQPVLDTLIRTAARLCDAEMANVLHRDDDVYREAAALGWAPEYSAFLEAHPITPTRGSITGRVALERRAVHIADIEADPEYILAEAAVLGKAHSMLGVPLLREGEPIGVIVLARQRVEPFTDRQIELVQTFADQAVIAIENTRLITETREALEQQTATAEILQVINSSPGNLQPVFEAILEKAHALGGASRGTLFLFDGDVIPSRRVTGLSRGAAGADAARDYRLGRPPPRGAARGRAPHPRPRPDATRRSDRPFCRRARRGTHEPFAPAAEGGRATRRPLVQSGGSPAVFRQADRAARKLRRTGGDRDRQCPAAGRDPSAASRIARDLRQYGRRGCDVRRRAAARRVEP